MITNLKALLVIMILSLTVLHFAKPLYLKFSTEADYLRRRNIWIGLTVTAFVSPSFWIYAVVAYVAAYISMRKEQNPIALFVMLMHVVPPFSVPLPSFVVNSLFDIDNFRIFELSILLPVAWRLVTAKNKNSYGNHKSIDVFILSYFALQIVVLMPYEDVTNTVRRAFLMLTDAIILVYVASRTCNDKKKLAEVLATFCLIATIFSSIALFEYLKVWLVYTGFSAVWDIPSQGLYLFRDGSLRAQASTGHSLVLGYFLALTMGFWLYFCQYIDSKKHRLIGTLAICIGLFSTLSRGPWLAAVVICCLYIFLDKNGIKKLLKKMLIILPFIGGLLLTPMGPKIIDKLPFVGSVDSGNVEYRQRLAESSWELIKANPFFGDPFYERHLEHMRQGEGIIDMVNVYAQISLPYGIVGLFLFFAPFALGMLKMWKKLQRTPSSRSDISSLGRGLLAGMLGTAFFIATASFYMGIPIIYYLLIGLASAFNQLKDAPTNQTTNGNKNA